MPVRASAWPGTQPGQCRTTVTLASNPHASAGSRTAIATALASYLSPSRVERLVDEILAIHKLLPRQLPPAARGRSWREKSGRRFGLAAGLAGMGRAGFEPATLGLKVGTSPGAAM
jgi:hypothetical protein